MVITLVPCIRHLCRPLSVLQGGLTIMYSDASFQYSLRYPSSSIEASGQSVDMQHKQNVLSCIQMGSPNPSLVFVGVVW